MSSGGDVRGKAPVQVRAPHDITLTSVVYVSKINRLDVTSR
jgi:hypothetical protein